MYQYEFHFYPMTPMTIGANEKRKLEVRQIVNQIKEKRREKDMKNFTSESSTMIGKAEKGTPFKKAKDFIGKYEDGEMCVLGYIKTHSDMYDKDQYSLYVVYQGEKFFMNVPSWYGKRLEQDFTTSKLTPEEYFENSFIETIKTFKTKYNTESISITVYR